MRRKIAWIIPYPVEGAGGIRTIVGLANFLASTGDEVDLYVEEDFISTAEEVRKKIIKYYSECRCGVYLGINFRKKYDAAFATFSLNTPDYLKKFNAEKKFYLIQDFEPWFEPVGDIYFKMENTYRYGFYGISIGKWLAHKINTEYDMPMASFDFCADLNIYKPLESKKEKAICFIYQPEKPRRCSELGVQALEIVKRTIPGIKIYLYGSNSKKTPSGFTNLGIISADECNTLYNKCMAGLCISSSNPSRIPFEMMASGLPVVDIYRENNLYDMPDEGVLLANPEPSAIANALIMLLNSADRRAEMSKFGINFMQDRPIEKGYQQFLTAFDSVMAEGYTKLSVCEKKYTKLPVCALIEKNEAKNTHVGIEESCSQTRYLRRKLRKIIRAIKSETKSLAKRIFRV